jgi:hypothetical protein
MRDISEVTSEHERQAAEALARIREACEALLGSDAPMVVNFAVRTLAEVRACETQLPGLAPPPHLLEAE